MCHVSQRPDSRWREIRACNDNAKVVNGHKLFADVYFFSLNGGHPVALDMYKLGRRLAAARELRDLTQQALANRAGLTQATIARIEKGRKPGLRLDTIVAVAEALGVSLDALVGKEADNELLSAATAR
jgi:DNA-binding XRE family transcriptional regulator